MISKLSIYNTVNDNREGQAVSTCPFRNLALEKYLTFHVQEGECILYLWQNERTVVIGRNQNAWNECRVSALQEDGGHLVRRLSGGGAVYHDLGNLNFTFCMRNRDYDLARQHAVILNAVKKLGIPAEVSGRNDLTAEGRKFSGNAFYEFGDFRYHHGTLLLDTDPEAMSRYLNVPEDKLKSKGVASVRSRVVNLKEYNPHITAELLSHTLQEAFGEVYGLTPEAFDEGRFAEEEVQKEKNRFASWEWNFGTHLPFTHSLKERFPWGGVELLFSVEDGLVKEAVCYSDAMDAEFISLLAGRFTGCRYGREELIEALDESEGETPLQKEMSRDLKALIRQEV